MVVTRCVRSVKYKCSHALEYLRNTRLLLKIRQFRRNCKIALREPSSDVFLFQSLSAKLLFVIRIFVRYILDSAKMLNKLGVLMSIASLLGNAFLLTALGLGLYTRWHYTESISILLIGFTGIFVFSISLVAIYYFSKTDIGNSLSRLYIGCMLGVVAFTEHSTLHDETTEITMNFLLITSLVIRCLNKCVQRIAGLSSKEPTLIDGFDVLETVGLAISAIATGKDFISVSLLLIAMCFAVTSIRLKSVLGLVNLCFLVIISKVYYFPMLELSANPFALGSFVTRVSFEAIIDLYFCTLTTLERWQPLLNKPSAIRQCLIILVFMIQLIFYGVTAGLMPKHKEWFIVVPMFAAFSVVWFCYHLVFLVTCWLLSNKITQCLETFESLGGKSGNLHRIMASKGVRHFSLISQRLVLVALASSVIVGLLGWTAKSPLSLSLLCMVVPLESAVVSLLWEMGSSLGGTCIGYALVAPALTVRTSGVSPIVLPSNTVQELSTRATQILSTVQRFFSYNLIETYGCDYSSSGLSPESVETKLKAFFQRVTTDGPRFDTYVLYYSGPVYNHGDWALSGDSTLKIGNLIEWWQEMDGDCGSRLILVLDTHYSYKWIKQVRRLSHLYVGIQASVFYPNTSSDLEEGDNEYKVGTFTNEWMDFNGGRIIEDLDLHAKSRSLRCAYGVSKCWTDFTFHLPTENDIAQHWNSNFPKVTRPLIKATNFPVMENMCCCFTCVIRCMKRKRMRWAPPNELDTGHGFRLVMS